MSDFQQNYKLIRGGAAGFYRQERGLIEVKGREAVQFLNGMITNDVAALEGGAQMRAAFPNAQGRLLAVVTVLKRDDKYFFETEAATREKVFQNLFRFTFAGDFFVEDISEKYDYFLTENGKWKTENAESVEFQSSFGKDIFVSKETAQDFANELKNQNAVEISDELYEALRIENGVPQYGVDMDETTIVPELGIADLISYSKGCYIGQEIIARIHFRGHVAKQLTGLIFEDERAAINPNDEIKSLEDKNAGRITSITLSPQLAKTIALAYVRYDYLAEGTELRVNDFSARVKKLPFIE